MFEDDGAPSALFDPALLGEPTDTERDLMARLVTAERPCAEAGLWPVPPSMTRTDRLGAAAGAFEVLTRKAQARGLRAVAELVRDLAVEEPSGHGMLAMPGEFVATEVAAALGVSRRTAEIRIDDALALTVRLPRTLAALEAGLVSMPVARVLVKETAPCSVAGAAEVESRVLDAVARGVRDDLGRLAPEEILFAVQLDPELPAAIGLHLSSGRVRGLARRAVAALDEEALRETPKRERHGDVDVWPTRPGMVFVGSEMTEAEALVVLDRIDDAAHVLVRDPDETRSLPELRSSVFRSLLLGEAGCCSRVLTPPAVSVNLDVVVDGRGSVSAGRLGAVTASTLDDLFAAAERTGGVVRTRPVPDVSCPGEHTEPGSYRPSSALVAAVRLRDRTCRFPGCTVPGTRCDLDHTRPHPHGPTCLCNLALLCRHHHRLKTFGGWTLINHGDGHLTWRSPRGRTYEVWPDHPPDDG